MSNIFKGAKSAGSKVEEDFVSSGFKALDTDVYTATIKTAYLGKAANSDAVSFNAILGVEVNGKKTEVRPQIWMTNRNGDVTYDVKDRSTGKKTGEQKNLPGYDQVNSLFMLVLGKDVGDAEVEKLSVKLYDFDAKKEIPQSVDCFPELHGEEIQIALQKQIIDVNKKNDSTGAYEPTGKTKEVNEVVKFFPGERLVTISEVAQHIKTLGGTLDDVLENEEMAKVLESMDEDAGEYGATWLEKNRGETYDRSSGKKAEGKSFGGGKSADSSTTAAKKKGLFS